jgi:hypothetical protein
MAFRKKDKNETPAPSNIPGLQKPKGMGKIVFGVIFLLLGVVLITAFIPLIPGVPTILTVSPSDYKDEVTDADEGTTWLVSGKIIYHDELQAGPNTIYFYSFEDEEDAGFTSSEDLGGNGTMVIVELEKTTMLPIGEVKASYKVMLIYGGGGFFALIGLLLIVVGILQRKKTKGRPGLSTEGNVDVSNLMMGQGGPSGGMSPPAGQQPQPPSGQQPMGMPGQNPPLGPPPGGAPLPPPPGMPGTMQMTQPGGMPLPPPPPPQNTSAQGGGMQELPGMDDLPDHPAPGGNPLQQPPIQTMPQPGPGMPQMQPGPQPGMGMPPQQFGPQGPQQPRPLGTPGHYPPQGQPPQGMPPQQPMQQPGQPQAPPMMPQHQPQTWTCPNCQTTVESKFAFCTSCGYKRN